MAEPTAQEILMLALINRARLDPTAEAARYGIDLNEGLAPGTISTASKQPLAFNTSLFAAADAHSQSMIDHDYFAHNDPNTGSTPQSRADAAGYQGGVGENIAWEGSTGGIDATAEIFAQHEALFVDSGIAGRGHRLNILGEDYQEVGTGQVIGVFTSDGTNYNSSMVTEDFGVPSAGGQFLTGLAYNDSDANAFYSVGEGRAGVLVTIGAGNQTTGTAGAYSGHIGSGAQAITFSGGGLAAALSLTATIVAAHNAMIDVIGQSTVETSVSITATANITTIIGLGTNGLSLTGTSAANTITGTIAGDTIDGAGGADTMVGGAGNDNYFVDHAGDVVTENPGEGNDTVYASVSLNLAANVEYLVMQGTADLQGYGNSLVNVIHGNTGSNILDGGAGGDAMYGGAGNDFYYIDNVSDLVIENPGEGNDTVFSSANLTLGANIEYLNLTGSADLQGYGNSLVNVMYGNTGSNILDGAAGGDAMYGGAGNDFYYVDNISDLVIENANEGNDTVFSSANLALGANIEYLNLTGSADLQGYGNSLVNVIYGNTGNNIIDGGTGGDAMYGGAGNDFYYVDNISDLIIENPSEGSDTVYATVNYQLSANAETLILQGSANLQAYGGAGANTIFGNAGSNLIDGGAGADTLQGFGGSDVFVFRPGQTQGDTVVDFSSGVDALQFAGFGAGATFTQVDSAHWEVNYSGGATHEVITFNNLPAIQAGDFAFV